MALTDLDRKLLDRCLNHEPEAWNEFVDRFLGVIYHVIHHTAHMRSLPIQSAEVDDLAADVLTRIVENEFKILRSFRGKSSLATYLAVIARRVAVNYLARQAAIRRQRAQHAAETATAADSNPDLRIDSEEEVRRLLDDLDEGEAELVRSYYLEHKSYKDISQDMGIPENSIGPMLARLRARLRKASPKT